MEKAKRKVTEGMRSEITGGYDGIFYFSLPLLFTFSVLFAAVELAISMVISKRAAAICTAFEHGFLKGICICMDWLHGWTGGSLMDCGLVDCLA